MLKPTQTNIYILGDNKYALINRRLYSLDECDDDQIAEAFNGGEVIPLIVKPT